MNYALTVTVAPKNLRSVETPTIQGFLACHPISDFAPGIHLSKVVLDVWQTGRLTVDELTLCVPLPSRRLPSGLIYTRSFAGRCQARVAICGDQTPVVLASADALVQHRCLMDKGAWGRTRMEVGLETC